VILSIAATLAASMMGSTAAAAALAFFVSALFGGLFLDNA
jgi:hypothetical protein